MMRQNIPESDPNARLPASPPLLCAITDRNSQPKVELLPYIRSAIEAGIDLIQIRESDLPPRNLCQVAREAVALSRGSASRILVNGRLDVALAASADGVHLPVRGLPVGQVRRQYPGMLIGASVHNLTELQDAERAGADFAVFGPVFSPLSKPGTRPPVGLEKLAEAAAAASVPVLALGGITEENARSCLEAGAAGLAGITLFQRRRNLAEIVARLRQNAGK